jgi:hypothetical protein
MPTVKYLLVCLSKTQISVSEKMNVCEREKREKVRVHLIQMWKSMCVCGERERKSETDRQTDRRTDIQR